MEGLDPELASGDLQFARLTADESDVGAVSKATTAGEAQPDPFGARGITLRVVAAGILVALLFGVAFFCLLRVCPDIPGGDDGYRHVKMASRLIRAPHATFANPWHLVYFWPKPVDPWFGYHVLLAPFTLFLDLTVAAKAMASVVFAGFALALLLLLKQMRVRHRLIWVALALCGSSVALHRAALTRPFQFSVVLVLFATLYTLRNKPLAVGITAAVHAFSYSIFFLVAFAPVINLVLRRDREAVKILCASMAGMATGLLCSPYFPENLRFGIVQAYAPFLIVSQHIPISTELDALNVWWIVASLPVAVVWIASLVRWVRTRSSLEAKPGTSLLLAMSVLSLAASVRTSRTFDYFVPVAVLSSAALLADWTVKRRNARQLALVLAPLCALTVTATVIRLKGEPSAARFRGVAQYLLEHDRGAVVANRWDQYARLFFWNAENTYVTGVAPEFMFLRDPGKYWLWRHITDDESRTCAQWKCSSGDARDVVETVARDLNAGYVVTEHDRSPRLEALLRGSPRAREVYRDGACSLFAIRAAWSAAAAGSLRIQRSWPWQPVAKLAAQ
jgi:hypothetical protein